MPLRESEAIVLRSFPLGEADRLVSLLSRTMGRLRGVACGARRPKSRFGAALEPLSHIRVWFYERPTRELVRISQCELLESFLEAQRDYQAGVTLALVSEVSEAVLPEREASETSFRLVLHVARSVKRTGKTALPLAYFALWTVRLGGWLSPLDCCSQCGRELGSEGAFASPTGAGLACKACRRPGMRSLSGLTLASAQRMLAEPLDRLREEGFPAVALQEQSEYLLDLIEHHIERKLNSRQLLEAKA